MKKRKNVCEPSAKYNKGLNLSTLANQQSTWREGARADRKAAFRANHRLFCAVQIVLCSQSSPVQKFARSPVPPLPSQSARSARSIQIAF